MTRRLLSHGFCSGASAASRVLDGDKLDGDGTCLGVMPRLTYPADASTLESAHSDHRNESPRLRSKRFLHVVGRIRRCTRRSSTGPGLDVARLGQQTPEDSLPRRSTSPIREQYGRSAHHCSSCWGPCRSCFS